MIKKQFDKIFNESISLGKSIFDKLEPTLKKIKKSVIKNPAPYVPPQSSSFRFLH